MENLITISEIGLDKIADYMSDEDHTIYLSEFFETDLTKLPSTYKELDSIYKDLKENVYKESLADGADLSLNDDITVSLLKPTSNPDKNSVIVLEDANWGKHVFVLDLYVKDFFEPQYYMSLDESSMSEDDYNKLVNLVEDFKKGNKSVIKDILKLESERMESDGFGSIEGIYDIVETQEFKVEDIEESSIKLSSKNKQRIINLAKKIKNI